MYPLPAKSQAYSTIVIDNFGGVDFTNTPSKCSPSRFTNAKNIIRLTPGKVGKRTGWHVLEDGLGRINGHHVLYGETGDVEFIHAGTNIYKYTPTATPTLTSMYTTAADAKSTSVMLLGALWLFDGKKLLKITADEITAADADPHVPKILTGKEPTGGGVSLEPINLLTGKRYEGFYGTTSATVYQLSTTSIESVDKVEKMDANGVFQTVSADDYTVNLTAGTVTFDSAPGISPVEGTDNINIWYTKTVTGYADRINKCTIATLYGISRGQDRIFCTGNPDYPNQDWFCEIRDPTYWGDLWYSALGDENSPILNYSILDNYLVAYKQNGENQINVYARTGTLEANTETINTIDVTYYEPAFAVQGIYQSEEAVAKYSFAMFNNEPLYLTARGIHALTLSSLTNQRNSELRSYYLNGATPSVGLLAEGTPADAHAVVFNGFYILCINNRCYILDGLQPVSEKGTLDSNSKKQYEGYYWDNVPARVMWTYGGLLYFGTSTGKICAFYNSISDTNSYYDDTTAVTCFMRTAHLRGKNEFSSMTVINIGYVFGAYPHTGAKIYLRNENGLTLIETLDIDRPYFTYEPFSYANFTYGGDSAEQTFTKKTRKVRKVDKVQMQFENNNAEPLALEMLEIYYRQGGSYKNRG